MFSRIVIFSVTFLDTSSGLIELDLEAGNCVLSIYNILKIRHNSLNPQHGKHAHISYFQTKSRYHLMG